jgi:hypothetical protein
MSTFMRRQLLIIQGPESLLQIKSLRLVYNVKLSQVAFV